MPVSTPNGYLDFTNATPRATKVIATSNVGVGTSNPEFNLDVHGTANVGTLTATSGTFSGDVYAPNLPLATIGSNLVTWNDSTGVFQDSGGLFSNKLAVVSEQPPSALAGASTTITNHGVYKVTASTGTAYSAFDKSAGTSWTASSNYTGGSGTGVYVPGTARLHTSTVHGDWITLEFPYKTTLRHLTFTGNIEKANLYATNDGGITWTELKNWESGETTVVVNASENYKKYGLVTTKTTGSATLSLTELRFFTESFAIDGGKVAMASGAITGGNTVMDQTGPHARHVVPLRKYPEIVFTEGEFEGNDSTNTYTRGGYTVSASSAKTDFKTWNAFSGSNNGNDIWLSETDTYSSGSPTNVDTFENTNGSWIGITLPTKIKLSRVYIRNRDNASFIRGPLSGIIWGSDGGSSWTNLLSFSNLENLGADEINELNINTDTYYDNFRIQITELQGNFDAVAIANLELYGYEETSDPDTSVDTKITSQFNLPDTTGVKLYIDGDKGSTATDFSGEGHTLTENNATYDSTEKAWEFSSLATSNVTMTSGDLAMEGTHPHSVSLWFNAANVSSNATLFHVGTAAGEGDAKTSISLTESGHLGWIDGGDNQFLSANTWHNLVYATQGGGGVRTCYLDGRKLGDISVQDTFGDYPPFAMTGYSQGGYTVTASSDLGSSPWLAWYAFDNTLSTTGWHTGSATDIFNGTNNAYNASSTLGGVTGAWLKLEMPHKLRLSYLAISNRNGTDQQDPEDFQILGSNDDVNWTQVMNVTGAVWTGGTTNTYSTTLSDAFYKYLALVVTRTNNDINLVVSEIQYYGHKENDTTRFPVSSTVLKYPHVAMTGPAQRGYVASASSYYNTGTEPEHGFDGVLTSTGLDHTWESGPLGNNTTSGSGRYTSGSTFNISYLNDDPYYGEGGFQTTESSNTWTGEWLQIELPHSINTTKYVFGNADGNSQWNDRIPTSGVILGSTNGSTWNLIHQFSSTLKDQTLTVSHTGYYKYFRIIGTTVGGTQTIMLIPEWELYGTEEDLDVVARVGEGLDGKVANFRVYDKYLREEQALELWDAQKDQFGRVESSVVVHKGRLGVGTTEPEGRFAVLDEAHAPEEFPPRAMTAAETYIEGHGVFKVSASVDASPSYYPSYVFDKSASIFYWDPLSGGARYSTSPPGNYLKSNRLAAETVLGEYLVLKLPYKIKLEHFTIQRQAGGWWLPQEIYYYAKSEDNDIWEQIYYHGSILGSYSSSGNSTDGSDAPIRRDINSNKFYRYFALVITKGNGGGGTSLREWRLFGTRERGQSTLHDGQLTLTKNLTVPRIGPALDADDTPRRDRLVVEYNTSTNPTANGTVKDTSGRGLDGRMVNGSYYDATEKALVFDGTDDYIRGSIPSSLSGNHAYSFSMWVKPNAIQAGYVPAFEMGLQTAHKSCGLYFNGGVIIHLAYSNNLTTTTSIVEKQWIHIVGTYTSGLRKIYADGVLLGSDTYSSLDIGDTKMTLGANNSNDQLFNGSISNFKLYDVALTADEVKRLYDMGRCDEGHHVVNFSKTRVGIGLGDGEAPTYTLDVRGQIRSQGSLVTSFTGQHKCVPENGEPVEKGLIVSASKNKFVKLNGGLDTGKKAITIDESLPVVSLSNVVQDKACFGVVSSTEEANTVYRIETTNGGVISHIPKTLGDNRVIVNSVGEGAIWVCDSNGPLESGDYITTSNIAGYGQKQDGAGLMNYTVAKITMDCDFTASNVAVQAIKKIETLKTVTEDVWQGLSDYDRSSNTETQYINESNVVLSIEEYESLASEEQNIYSETTIQTYYRIQRGDNVLDEHGMLQWEDTGATEPGYELRYLDASGQQTDEANCVHRAAFVGCTYHCG